jgi:poly(A) polymerase
MRRMPETRPDATRTPPADGPSDAGLPDEFPGPLVVRGGGRIRQAALDPDAVEVVRRLQRSGHEAYLVGGCVRDLLLGLEPKDFDVATDASPNRVKRLFRNAFVIGRRFRLTHVRFQGGKVVETATFRRDPGEQGLHPERAEGPIYSDNVFGTAREDAFRRDFTVNALFYDPSNDEVVDWIGGLADLESRTIRAIGDPTLRLREDPVRMIRAVHFAARMGGTIEPVLLEAIRACASEIGKTSGSRLYVELMKVLTRGAARPTMHALHGLGVLGPWFPDLAAFLDRPIEWPAEPGGTHEAAARGEPEDVPGQHLTWNLLGAADAWGLAARGAPDSLALAAFLGPWILDTFRTGPRLGHDVAFHAEALFRPLALRMSVPRRASMDLRDLLWMQRHLHHPPSNPRRLRSLVFRPAFREALAYLELDVRARGGDPAVVARWQAIHDEAYAGEPRRGRGRGPREPGTGDGRPGAPGRSRDGDGVPAPRVAPAAPSAAHAPPRAPAPRPSAPPAARPRPAPPPAPPRPPANDRPFGAGLV